MVECLFKLESAHYWIVSNSSLDEISQLAYPWYVKWTSTNFNKFQQIFTDLEALIVYTEIFEMLIKFYSTVNILQ